jgi:thiamine pyrophosphate-dependent acetolactate synthase large subunit-like protein
MNSARHFGSRGAFPCASNNKERVVTEERSGANILVEGLVRQGVEFVFGYPGGAVLPIYDALFGEERIRHILVRHEAGAAHAAEGYARSTGKPGVVLVTSGPGATNAMTGIADAFLDSIPLVVITGQVPTALIGSDAFQPTPSACRATAPSTTTWFAIPRSLPRRSTRRSRSPPPAGPARC